MQIGSFLTRHPSRFQPRRAVVGRQARRPARLWPCCPQRIAPIEAKAGVGVLANRRRRRSVRFHSFQWGHAARATGHMVGSLVFIMLESDSSLNADSDTYGFPSKQQHLFSVSIGREMCTVSETLSYQDYASRSQQTHFSFGTPATEVA